MRFITFLLLPLLLLNCTNNRTVYWCGDHACVNNKEKKLYFKNNMTIEIREIYKKKNKYKSELEIIKKQAGIQEKNILKTDETLISKKQTDNKISIKEQKKITKQILLEEKKRIKEEKRLEKLALLEEKKRIKEEKKLLKQALLDEKERIKEEKKLLKQARLKEKKSSSKPVFKTKNTDSDSKIVLSKETTSVNISSKDFTQLVEKITKTNTNKSFPNINDIPN